MRLVLGRGPGAAFVLPHVVPVVRGTGQLDVVRDDDGSRVKSVAAVADGVDHAGDAVADPGVCPDAARDFGVGCGRLDGLDLGRRGGSGDQKRLLVRELVQRGDRVVEVAAAGSAQDMIRGRLFGAVTDLGPSLRCSSHRSPSARRTTARTAVAGARSSASRTALKDHCRGAVDPASGIAGSPSLR